MIINLVNKSFLTNVIAGHNNKKAQKEKYNG